MADKNPGLTIKFIYKTRPPAIEKQKVGMIIKEETSKEELCRNIDLIKFEVNKGTSIIIGSSDCALVFQKIIINEECIGYTIGPLVSISSNVEKSNSLLNKQKTEDYFHADELDIGIRVFFDRVFCNNPKESVYKESNLFDLIQNHVIENKLKEFDGVIKY